MRMTVLLAATMVLCRCSYVPVGKTKSNAGKDAVRNVGVEIPSIAHGCLEDSGNDINLDIHKGTICVGRGSLFALKVTPISYQLESYPPKHKYAKVQLVILDGDGKPIEGVLMMWRQTELQAKLVEGVAVFENLFIPRSLPADAQLRVTGAKLASDSNDDAGYSFDISTLLGSGSSFSINSVRVLESWPVKYVWQLGYWPRLELGSVVDWYIEAGETSTAEPAVSEVMQTQVTQNNYYRYGNATNPSLELRAGQTHPDDAEGDEVLRDLPDCYRLVTKITEKSGVSSTNNEGKKVIVAVSEGRGKGCSF